MATKDLRSGQNKSRVHQLSRLTKKFRFRLKTKISLFFCLFLLTTCSPQRQVAYPLPNPVLVAFNHQLDFTSWKDTLEKDASISVITVDGGLVLFSNTLLNLYTIPQGSQPRIRVRKRCTKLVHEWTREELIGTKQHSRLYQQAAFQHAHVHSNVFHIMLHSTHATTSSSTFQVSTTPHACLFTTLQQNAAQR